MRCSFTVHEEVVFYLYFFFRTNAAEPLYTLLWRNIYIPCITRADTSCHIYTAAFEYYATIYSAGSIHRKRGLNTKSLYTEPLLFSLSYPQKRPTYCTLKSSPAHPSCRRRLFSSLYVWSPSITIFQSVVHRTIESNSIGNFSLFLVFFSTRRFI